MKYKYLHGKITSDVMFEAYGKTEKEVFENAAEAMSETICILKKVKPKRTIKVEVKGDNLKDLLYNWLQEIIAQVDLEEMFFSKFKITKLTKTKLTAELSGEPISKAKGETIVKAVTYHGFDLVNKDGKYTATVSVDI